MYCFWFTFQCYSICLLWPLDTLLFPESVNKVFLNSMLNIIIMEIVVSKNYPLDSVINGH